MKHVILTFLIALAAAPHAAAYAPELVLQKASRAEPEIDAPSVLQSFHPFSRVSVSYSDLDLEKKHEREYSLSLRPKGFTEAKTYHALSRSLAREAELTRKLIRGKQLQLAYSLLINSALALEQGALAKSWMELMEKSQQLSAIEARRSQLDVKSLVRSNSDLQKEKNQVIETEAEVTKIASVLAQYGLSLNELETGDLLTPDEIVARLEKMPAEARSLSVEKAQSELELARADTAYANAQRSRWLDDVKFSMREERNNNKQYRMEITFNLPFLAARDLDEMKDNLKLVKTEVDSQQALDELGDHRRVLTEKLRQKIGLFRAVESATPVEKSADAVARHDPAFALELQRTAASRRLLRATLLAEIRTLYVELLVETGTLAEQSDVNHLSKSQRRI